MFTLPPQCPKCGHTSFELAEPPFGGIKGVKYKMHFVACSSCHAAITVLSQYDAGVAAHEANVGVATLKKQVSSLEAQVGHLTSLVQQLVINQR